MAPNKEGERRKRRPDESRSGGLLGITEFRRKNNAYCGTHKAVGHKTLMSGQANGAQARTTCIFMSTTRSVRGFFPSLVSLRVGPHNVGHTTRAYDVHTYYAVTRKHYNL